MNELVHYNPYDLPGKNEKRDFFYNDATFVKDMTCQVVSFLQALTPEQKAIVCKRANEYVEDTIKIPWQEFFRAELAPGEGPRQNRPKVPKEVVRETPLLTICRAYLDDLLKSSLPKEAYSLDEPAFILLTTMVDQKVRFEGRLTVDDLLKNRGKKGASFIHRIYCNLILACIKEVDGEKTNGKVIITVKQRGRLLRKRLMVNQKVV